MGKRGNGEGSWKERSDGRWEWSVMLGCRDNGKKKSSISMGRLRKK